MSLPTWTPAELSSESSAISCKVWRIVEAQHIVSTLKVVDTRAEQELLEAAPDNLSVDVLVAPHHGSKTSSTPDFIAAVQPEVTIFTVGYRNRFGHPKQAVLERYAQAGSKIYRSDQDGAVALNFAKDKAITMTRWRYQTQRYWQDAVFPETDTPD